MNFMCSIQHKLIATEYNYSFVSATFTRVRCLWFDIIWVNEIAHGDNDYGTAIFTDTWYCSMVALGSVTGFGVHISRADSRVPPSQRETALLCNDVSHWLGANLESVMY